jgi:hypothetical protein
MPLFRRRPTGDQVRQATVVPPDAVEVDLTGRPAGVQPPPGDLACRAGTCSNTTGTACAYVDRRGRACDTAWCPEHRDVVADRVYCHRHAGTMRAFAGDYPPPFLPDVDNRAPGLVEWMARDLDDGIRELLMATGAGGAVATDPSHLLNGGRGCRRVWERSWRLCNHTGFAQRVGLQVAEAHDTEIVIHVGHCEVARAVPPWIAAHRSGTALPPAEDARRRVEFRQALLVAVRDGLADATTHGPVHEVCA